MDKPTFRYAEDGTLLAMLFDCPGCGHAHEYRTAAEARGQRPAWEFSGTEERPTWEPSYRAQWVEGLEGTPRPPVEHCCHFRVEDGYIAFYADSTHDLAGHEVPLIGDA